MRPAATLYIMVNDAHVCPFGIKAKDLLKRHGFAVDDRHLTSRAQTEAFKAEQYVKTTPQVFIDGERFGGYDALRGFFGMRTRTAGATSVIKAVFVDRRELKCACVGGNSNLPLGFVSLTWNSGSVNMAVNSTIIR